MKKEDIIQLFDSFNNMKVLIVGDAMIDAYMWGKIERQSPEAAVPVVEIEKHENRLGGAGNVARNIKSLGATPVLCSVVGDDFRGKHLKQLLKEEALSTVGILTEKSRKTTVKTRVISENKHQLRIDEEDTFSIKVEQEFLELVYSNMKDVAVIILQDYNKGVLTPFVIESIIKKANVPQRTCSRIRSSRVSALSALFRLMTIYCLLMAHASANAKAQGGGKLTAVCYRNVFGPFHIFKGIKNATFNIQLTGNKFRQPGCICGTSG